MTEKILGAHFLWFFNEKKQSKCNIVLASFSLQTGKLKNKDIKYHIPLLQSQSNHRNFFLILQTYDSLMTKSSEPLSIMKWHLELLCFNFGAYANYCPMVNSVIIELVVNSSAGL